MNPNWKEAQQPHLLRKNEGTPKDPKWLYYVCDKIHPINSAPDGVVLSGDRTKAKSFPTQEHATNFLGGLSETHLRGFQAVKVEA